LNRLLICLVALSPLLSVASNTASQSFNKAKKQLLTVYQEHRETLYCRAAFDAKGQVITPPGFTTTTYLARAKKIEWEHVVPAENFGKAFSEWREGHRQCVDSKGKSFKGRKCAEKMNNEYRYMQADMHNLFPAIGAVNAKRSNYNFTLLPSAQSDFGACDMRIEGRKAQPPELARGRIARSYLYMDQSYSKYSMSKPQRQLMSAWDKQYPVNVLECQRAKKIAAIQLNDNEIVKSRCQQANIW
jgi:deoxyribonuclease-1